MNWGNNAGCAWLTSQCNTTSAWAGRYALCTPTTGDACNYDGSAWGYCPIASYGTACLPAYARNVVGANCTTSGYPPELDFCPLTSAYTNTRCDDASQTRDAAFGQAYGAGSKCFRNSLIMQGFVSGAPPVS